MNHLFLISIFLYFHLNSYVEWSLHNPHDGEYNWEGIADLVKFLEIAQEEDFYIVLRPGPYICAERDNVSDVNWIGYKLH